MKALLLIIAIVASCGCTAMHIHKDSDGNQIAGSPIYWTYEAWFSPSVTTVEDPETGERKTFAGTGAAATLTKSGAVVASAWLRAEGQKKRAVSTTNVSQTAKAKSKSEAETEQQQGQIAKGGYGEGGEGGDGGNAEQSQGQEQDQDQNQEQEQEQDQSQMGGGMPGPMNPNPDDD